MSRFAQIRTTIPPRTFGAGRKSASPRALLLRMSFLELERQRRTQEIEQLQARAIKLQARIEAIEREKSFLRVALENRVEPLAAAGAVPVSRAAMPPPANGRARGGFPIRY
jgi:hypothetical protein